MSIASHIVVFAVSWWLILFMVLPFGVKSQLESDEDYVKGSEAGAPTNPNMRKKIIITTAITTVVWAIFWAVVEFELIRLS